MIFLGSCGSSHPVYISPTSIPVNTHISIKKTVANLDEHAVNTFLEQDGVFPYYKQGFVQGSYKVKNANIHLSWSITSNSIDDR